MMDREDTLLEISLSAKSERSTTLSPPIQRWKNAPLHERCNVTDIIKLKKAFTTFGNKLTPKQFRELLQTLLNIEYDDEEFNILFMKINSNRCGVIDWSEFVSHLMLGFFANDPENQRASLQLPITESPTVIRSHHRHSITRICFCPDVAQDRSVDRMQGKYITMSRDGMLNWWSLDLTLLRSTFSVSPSLKVCATWVTDMTCMPDVNIIVTSSTERDLRFYDCTAKTFTLRLVITSWEHMICSFDYFFQQDANKECVLVCGDSGGHVRVLTFSPVDRGPFRNTPGASLVQIRHRDLQKRVSNIPMRLVELTGVHSGWVRQVRWYDTLGCVLSCAACPDAMVLRDLTAKVNSVFRVEKGVQCFAADTQRHVVVSGGLDRVVRVWSAFVPTRPTAELHGHRSAVVALVLSDPATVYSVSRDRAIKVWDLHSQLCVQTYVGVPAGVGSHAPLAALYRGCTRELLLGGARLARLAVGRREHTDRTDGRTHAKPVAAVLYNPLFRLVITVGMDSIIINWDVLTGKRNAIVRDAHTWVVQGEVIPVEMTAACFDPAHQLLLTGARDGTLKVWNFNTGECLRKMAIEHMCEVANVFWVEGRILAVGWNRHVTEFEAGPGAGPGGAAGEGGKAWETRHTDDVLAAAARPPYTLATASYNSELVFWKLETGQPYRQFSVAEPSLRIKMIHSKRSQGSPKSPLVQIKRPSITRHLSDRESLSSMSSTSRKTFGRRASGVALPAGAAGMRRLAAHAALALNTRPASMHVASFLLALDNGKVQCWSEHAAGGLRGTFRAAHAAGDYVAALATDQQNRYLFTGTTVGYVKVWLLTNYLSHEKVHVSMPKLRLTFPFLWRDRIEGRAKRSVRGQRLPLLLNSYRAHLRCVTSLAFVDEMELLLTASSDCSVRVWRLSGEYLQTLGGHIPWSLEQTRFPPDVQKVASFTTLKVWRGGEVSRYVPGRPPPDTVGDVTALELRTHTYGVPLPAPPLPRTLEPPPRPLPPPPPELDDSLPTIPLYTHLRLAGTAAVRRAQTPPLVRDTRLREAQAKLPRTHFDPNLI
ncbi:WD repeat-containing protein on Y chromosome isoform X2 [Aricia agestis]|uniref:WD repeat-containing protein on Y chromosome isoform X2 n=1 Tax=Aricia agestis TaxID=91739 RepID=UPI001C20785A|nr:WD repeat-containing protein on Y chromosome isoform X2 [Aricia agestis]